MVRHQIDSDNDGVRLDRILRKKMSRHSLSEIYRLIRVGKIRISGKHTKQNYRVKSGDSIEIDIGDSDTIDERKVVSDKISNLVHTEFYKKNFFVLYEDESLLVCNKPYGLVVHGGTGHLRCDTLIDMATSYIKQKSGKGRFTEPILVHRLDRDTSGIILIAKELRTLRSLHSLIKNNEMEKLYIALCHGIPPTKKGTIDLFLTKTHERNSGMKVTVGDDGQKSISKYTVLSSAKGMSLIQVKLETGRTHQIRVHLEHIGCPIAGDVRYGDAEKDAALFAAKNNSNRLYLHAQQLTFIHPLLSRKATFCAPLPPEFKNILKSCGFLGIERI